jgi:hypothetical protein
MNWKINHWYLVVCTAIVGFHGAQMIMLMMLDAPNWGEKMGMVIFLIGMAIVVQLLVYVARAVMALVAPLVGDRGAR